jgi:hypothetical protein
MERSYLSTLRVERSRGRVNDQRFALDEGRRKTVDVHLVPVGLNNFALKLKVLVTTHTYTRNQKRHERVSAKGTKEGETGGTFSKSAGLPRVPRSPPVGTSSLNEASELKKG